MSLEVLASVIIRLTVASIFKKATWRRITEDVRLYIYYHGKAMTVRDYYRPMVFQEVESPRFLDNRHMKVVWLSALRTGRLYLPGNIPITNFC